MPERPGDGPSRRPGIGYLRPARAATRAAGTAGHLLGDLGIKPDRVRRAIPAAVGAAALGYTDAQQLLAPTAASRLDAIDRRLDQVERRLQAFVSVTADAYLAGVSTRRGVRQFP
jgi:hypothetical protein